MFGFVGRNWDVLVQTRIAAFNAGSANFGSGKEFVLFGFVGRNWDVLVQTRIAAFNAGSANFGSGKEFVLFGFVGRNWDVLVQTRIAAFNAGSANFGSGKEFVLFGFVGRNWDVLVQTRIAAFNAGSANFGSGKNSWCLGFWDGIGMCWRRRALRLSMRAAPILVPERIRGVWVFGTELGCVGAGAFGLGGSLSKKVYASEKFLFPVRFGRRPQFELPGTVSDMILCHLSALFRPL